MEQLARFDPRLSLFSRAVKNSANPHTVYYDKAKDIRAERIEGVVHLYRMADIVAINRHPSITGTGGRDLRSQCADSLANSLMASSRTAASTSLRRSAFCVPLPCQTFLRIMGAPIEDFDFFIEFKNAVIHPKGDTTEEIDMNMALGGAKLLEYFTTFLAKRRAEAGPAEDVIGILLRSEVDGEPLTDPELLNILFLFMFAGLDTVTSTMSCTFAWLAQHPEERRRLVEDKSLIPAAVEELLRFESPVPSGLRYCDKEDIDLGDGLIIRKGEAIHAIWAAANVDPEAFEDPLTVKFGRRANHIAFASGVHRCLGSHLARLEMRVAVEELLSSIPDFALQPGDDLVYDNVPVRNVTYLPITFKPRVHAPA